MRIDDLIESVGNKSKESDNSMVITALTGDIDRLKIEFPGFRFSHIYGGYWLVYFNKSI